MNFTFSPGQLYLSLKNQFYFVSYSSYKNGFRIYLQLERGLSENTLNAYLHDVDLLFRFLLEEKKDKSISEITLDDLRGLVTYIHQIKLGESSQSRVISGIKAFFRYLML